jgi:hypothetical protein
MERLGYSQIFVSPQGVILRPWARILALGEHSVRSRNCVVWQMAGAPAKRGASFDRSPTTDRIRLVTSELLRPIIAYSSKQEKAG